MPDSSGLLFQFTLYSFAMMATPGPNNAVLMAVGISHGYKATLPHILAISFMGAIMLLLVGCGLGEIFIRFPLFYRTLQAAGVAYMIWLAARIAGFDLKAGVMHLLQKETGENKKSVMSMNTAAKPMTFVQATLFQLVNVKAWLGCVVGISMFSGASDDLIRRLAVMMGIYIVVGLVGASIWGAGGAFLGQFLSSEGMRRCNYVFAGFLLLSIALVFL